MRTSPKIAACVYLVAACLSTSTPAHAADQWYLSVLGNYSLANTTAAVVNQNGNLQDFPLGPGFFGAEAEIGSATAATVPSDASVTVFSSETDLDFGTSLGAFVAFPPSAAGSRFRLVSPSVNPFSGRFVVIALEETTISYVPSTDWSLDILAGSAHNVTLKEGEVFTTVAPDLSGSLLTTSAPVQVLVGSNCAVIDPGAFCDQAVSPLMATTQWGHEYVVPPSKNDQKQVLVKIITDEASDISFDGVFRKSMTPGEVFETRVDPLTQIESTKPVLVTAFMEDESDEPFGGVDMTVLPPTRQWKLSHDVFIPTHLALENFLTVVAPVSAVLTVNNAAPGAWKTKGQYKSTRIAQTSTRALVQSDLPISVYAEGTDVDSSYLFSLGQRFDSGTSTPSTGEPTPTPTSVPEPSTTPTPTPNPVEPTVTPSPTATASAEPSAAVTPTPTATPTVQSSVSPSTSPEVTPTESATATSLTTPEPSAVTPSLTPTVAPVAPPAPPAAAPPTFGGGGGGGSNDPSPVVAAAPMPVVAVKEVVAPVVVKESLSEPARVVGKNVVVSKAAVPAMAVSFGAASKKLSAAGLKAIRLKARSLRPGTVVTCIGYSGVGSNASALRALALDRAKVVCGAYKAAAKVQTKVVFGGTLRGTSASNRKVIVRFS